MKARKAENASDLTSDGDSKNLCKVRQRKNRFSSDRSVDELGAFTNDQKNASPPVLPHRDLSLNLPNQETTPIGLPKFC